MQKFYYELFFKVEKSYEKVFTDFIFDLGIEALEEKDGGFFIRSEDSLENIDFALGIFVEKLSTLENKEIFFQKKLERKENKDWIEEYKKSINPILIDNVYIHTSWQEPKENCLNIKINPALAFGSGHHESTHSCIKFLQKYIKKNMLALDIGCGSGILAIIIAKYLCKVDICDTDILAIESAKKNAKINSVKFQNIWHGSVDQANKKYDLVVANLIADIILILENDIKKCLNDNAILILSGILDKYENRIKDKFKDLKLIDKIQSNEWISLVYKKEI
ncbi:50S ribosomal protein L11 methyltransferase [Campylobacter sp. 2018MI35]|uniref:50S ribosomal protein L11 methyltransferase n=1 Tax=unclassified Campylobacter TaxID=2593542 RepID=UPI00190504C4|nr:MULTISPECIES: 50S ribosomal protein L11 methyltransferase [unclassified Campylobacter]MBK1971552.1 50S ribosomal protein L11 methyltransferase [Campylobacter sp. TTU_617]MBK1991501.1 50S ribosomal protein L11 methyltransferase [Campylobacter sp. 2018MI34]